jgi:sigma-B regulation protein RsbU (phosphoserine phosphatase)
MNILLVDPLNRLPSDLGPFLSRSGWTVERATDYAAADVVGAGRPPDVVVAAEPPAGPNDPAQAAFRRLLDGVQHRECAALVLTPRPWLGETDENSFVDALDAGVTKEEIRGRLAAIHRYHAMVRGMDRELRNMRRLSERLNQSFTEWDQELRLAGRLQRDFLPAADEPIGPLRFSLLFRPASWVSGDIYDVYRVDEEHVAFYVADAVGHGVAASLLTMFIKKAIVSKRIIGDRYELLSASETMQGLNDALAAQQLPNCQFVTACYCLFNTRTLELECCRGGHPYPYLVGTDGSLREIKTAGGLLGLFPDETFPSERVRLQPGEKLILYSDGLELAFHPQDNRADEFTFYREAFRELCAMPAADIVDHLNRRLDDQTGSLNPRDDVTVVVAEVLPS